MTSGVSYANTLRAFATAVHKIEPSFAKDEIELLAQDCCKLSKKEGIWKYELKGFDFPTRDFKGAKLDKIHPERAKDFKVILSIEISGNYLSEGDLSDPIKHLSLNIVVVAPGVAPELIFCAWHLDSHPPEDPKAEAEERKKEAKAREDAKVLEEKKGKTKPDAKSKAKEEAEKKEKCDKEKADKKKQNGTFAHPRYHWQYGGKEVWGQTDDFYGSHLLLESPRLPHPPLDIILAIDFVFANYYSKQWQDLRDQDEYQKVIESVQEKYWRPYFATINSNWASGKAIGAVDLMPFLFEK